MNKINFSFLLYFISSFLCSLLGFSQEFKKPIYLPSYEEILQSQLNCDSRAFDKLPWLKERDSAHLAIKVWTLVDQVQVREEERQHIHNYGKTRSFVLSYRIYAIFRCGEPVTGFVGKQGTEASFLPFVMEGWNHPGTFEIRGDSKIKKEEDNEERSPFDLTVSDYLGDEPPRLGREGFSCFVKVPDFLRSPLKSINLDQLCKGEPKTKRLTTEKEIQKIWKLLKN
jgi:hypothetical protein